MPRYFFNVHDGKNFLDREGRELPGWEEARLVAIQTAGHIIADDARRLAVGEDWRLEVTDETGLILFRLDFRVLESPAMMGSHRHRVEPT